MKNRYSLIKKTFGVSVIVAACSLVTACDSDKEYTTGMPESQLINSIELDVTKELPLAIGADSTLVYYISPENADNRNVRWKSSDENVATVSADGTIHAKTLGKTIISVTPERGFAASSATPAIEVVVIDKVIKATSLELTATDADNQPVTSIYEKEELQLTPKILPETHTYSYLTWGSSNENIATVSKTGEVTGVNAAINDGKVTIYAYTHDKSGVVGEYNLQVKQYKAATNVLFDSNTATIAMLGSVVLTPRLEPSDATVSSITWTSKDPDVATVVKGKVVGVGFGTTDIIATCDNGASASVKVTVDSGWYIWDADNSFKYWKHDTRNTDGMEVKDGKMIVHMRKGGTWRGDLTLTYQTDLKTVTLNWNNYHVFAMKANMPDGGNKTLDYVMTTSGKLGNNKFTVSKLNDGTSLFYIDILSANPTFDVTNEVICTTFTMKIADAPLANSTTGTYEVHWIRTFKSVEEMNEFVQNELNANN